MTKALIVIATAGLLASSCTSADEVADADSVDIEVAPIEDTVAEITETTTAEDASDHSHDNDDEHSHDDATVASGLPDDADFSGEYEIINEEFGTEVRVTLTDEFRVMSTNALPPWEAGEFPEGNNTPLSEQDIEYQLPLEPTFVGDQSNIRTFGVSVAGIKFDAGTAQVARCENGVQYRVEAVQELIPFGIDANNAHVQNDGTYHYHDVPLAEIDGDDPEFIGWAFDGHRIFYSPTNEYPSSYQLRTDDREGVNCTYSEPDLPEMTFDATPDGTFGEDWEYVARSGELDECNGIEIDGEYVYFLTDTYPLIPRCLNGEVPGGGGGGGGAGGGEGGRPPRDGGAPPEGGAPEGE